MCVYVYTIYLYFGLVVVFFGNLKWVTNLAVDYYQKEKKIQIFFIKINLHTMKNSILASLINLIF